MRIILILLCAAFASAQDDSIVIPLSYVKQLQDLEQVQVGIDSQRIVIYRKMIRLFERQYNLFNSKGAHRERMKEGERK